MSKQKCEHVWKQYAYQKRTDRPGEIVSFYECNNCNKLDRGFEQCLI